jgi:hypothetical protein
MEPDRYTTVLVGVINKPADWAILQEQHWYRIPVRSAPQRGVNAPVIAFYQTKAFADDRWTISYFAYAREWRTVSRIQLLPDEPDHPRAQEPYYQVLLGNLQRLEHPIASRQWRRITFIVTHWQRLVEAREISELLHGTIWEERLWRALRRIGRLAEDDDYDNW